MTNKLNFSELGNSLTAYIGLGVFIVLCIAALIFFSYVFVIGAAIGLVMFLIGYVRKQFSGNKPQATKMGTQKHRVIDQE